MQFSNPYQQILAGGMVPGTTKRQRRAMRAAGRGGTVQGTYVAPGMSTRSCLGWWIASCEEVKAFLPGMLKGCNCKSVWLEKGEHPNFDNAAGWYCYCTQGAPKGPPDPCFEECAGLFGKEKQMCLDACITAPSNGIPMPGPGPAITAPTQTTAPGCWVKGKYVVPCPTPSRASNPRVTAELTPGSSMRSRRVGRTTNPMIPGMQFGGEPNFGPGAIQLQPGALQGVQLQPGALQAAAGGGGAQPAGAQQPGVVPVWPYWPGYQQPYQQPYAAAEPSEPMPLVDETCCYDSEERRLVCPSDDSLDGRKAKAIETKFREGYAMSLVRSKALGKARWMWHCR